MTTRTLRPIVAIITLGGLVAALLLSSLEAQAQTARIGVLASGTPSTSAPSLDAFRQRLRELGYVEGRNVVFEVRYASGHSEQFRDQAAKLVTLGVDVIVAGGTLGTRAAKEKTTTIPIVMVGVGDAVGTGLVESLARPGGNVTGTSFLGPEMALKGLDLITETLPKATRVALLFNPEITPEPWRNLYAGAQARAVALQPVKVVRPEDLDAILKVTAGTRPNALLVFALSLAQQEQIARFAVKNRLPALFLYKQAVDAGGLMSFGPKFLDLWRGTANYVDRILKGTKPGDLPVEQPTTFELAINLKTAKTFGLTIPNSVLARADHVIE